MASQTDRIETARSSLERNERVEHVIVMEERSYEQDIFEACIFKVNEGLLRTNYYAYTPSFISIGPYHHDELSIIRKEQFKSEYLQALLKRTNDLLTTENLLEMLKNLEPRARRCYGDAIRMEGDQFLEMLLLDGCFVVEFFIRSKYKVLLLERKDECSPTPKVDDWTEAQVIRDMLLMENQLPFFVLNEIYQLIDGICTIFHPHEVPFLNLVTATFLHMPPKLRYFSLIDTRVNEHEIKHLLQVMHILCCPVNEGQQRSQASAAGNDFSIESCHIRSASELQEAGVHFKKVGDIDDNCLSNTNLFDIKFNDGILEIPSFKLVASTETLFRNLIFYEQRSIGMRSKYFSEYAVFMDNLINTKRDVSLLRLKGIIINGLGDDKKVADLFNNLSQEVVYSCHDFYYAGVCYELIQHCNKPWNVMMTKLRHDYFNSPWAGISTGAAFLLLLLTAAQTVAAFLGLRHK